MHVDGQPSQKSALASHWASNEGIVLEVVVDVEVLVEVVFAHMPHQCLQSLKYVANLVRSHRNEGKNPAVLSTVLSTNSAQ